MCAASLFLLSSGWPAIASAAEAPEQPRAVGEESEQEAVADPGGERKEEGTVLDRHKKFMDTQVKRATRWIDGFFANSNYEEEAAESQFRFRPELYYRDEQGAKLKSKVRARLELPNLGRRISLIAGSDDEIDPSSEFVDDSDQHAIAGLQFLLSDSENWHTSIVAGAKFGNFAFFVGPRFRYQVPVSERTLARFTQTLRWQTNNHWDIGSRGDLYFVLSDRLYFRQTLYGRWRGEKRHKEGLQTQVSSVLSQRLSSTAGLQYDFTTIVHTEPDTHVDKYTLSVRYRKQTPKKWLYYEIAPQVSFEDKYDYDANPGIRLRLELYYGKSRSSDFWEHDSKVSQEPE